MRVSYQNQVAILAVESTYTFIEDKVVAYFLFIPYDTILHILLGVFVPDLFDILSPVLHRINKQVHAILMPTEQQIHVLEQYNQPLLHSVQVQTVLHPKVSPHQNEQHFCRSITIAPIRGCSPTCFVMSIRLCATRAAASAASTTPCGCPTKAKKKKSGWFSRPSGWFYCKWFDLLQYRNQHPIKIHLG